jgi:peroxiredoxin
MAFGPAPALAHCGSCGVSGTSEKSHQQKQTKAHKHKHAESAACPVAGAKQVADKASSDKPAQAASDACAACPVAAKQDKSECAACPHNVAAVMAVASAEAPEHATVGMVAPMFELPDQHGNVIRIADLVADDKIVVLEWFNPDCPFVVKHYEKRDTIRNLAYKYHDKDVVFLAVNSSHYADQEYNEQWAEKWDIYHSILNDQSGKVGRVYQARTTPHMYIIDRSGTLVYAGALDNEPSTQVNRQSDDYVNYVDQALVDLTAGRSVATAETKPYGCSVKYAQPTAEKTDSSDSVAARQ